MRTILLNLIFICAACGQSKDNNHSKSNNSVQQTMQTKLIGLWESDETDILTIKTLGKVTINFTVDGKLIYDIHEGDKLQRINMVYKVVGNTIISDQPSHPQEQKTAYKFVTEDKLMLEFDGEQTLFNRQIK